MAHNSSLALYCRVSTVDQSLDAQLAELRAYADRVGTAPVEFIDHGVSGRRDRRPALDQLLVAVRRREVSAVVCTELSRLARSVKHLCDLAAELEAAGVTLVVLRQAIDTGSPSGKLLFHTLAAVAQFEVDILRERTRAGLAAARRRGRHPGRPRAMDSSAVARALRLRASGKSIRAIARMLDVGSSTVARALRE